MSVAGIVLAGGQGVRMGGGKPLRPLAGRPLIAHVIDRLRPQVAALALSVARDDPDLAAFGLTLVHDIAGSGPLAGVLGGMAWAAQLPGCAWLATTPCDTPFLPTDLVARLAEVHDVEIAYAVHGERAHYTAALWSLSLRADLAAALAAGERRMHAWLATRRTARVRFDAAADPFANINTPEDLAAAEQRLIHP